MTKKVTPKKSEWKPVFLEHLRRTANVSRSAKEAGIARQVAYKARQDSNAFSDAWDDAIEEGIDYLEEEARRRAFEGTERPVFYQGEEVGYVREFSDTLMIFLLKGRRTEVYGDKIRQEHSGPGGAPIEQKQETQHVLPRDDNIRKAIRVVRDGVMGGGTEPGSPGLPGDEPPLSSTEVD